MSQSLTDRVFSKNAAVFDVSENQQDDNWIFLDAH